MMRVVYSCSFCSLLSALAALENQRQKERIRYMGHDIIRAQPGQLPPDPQRPGQSYLMRIGRCLAAHTALIACAVSPVPVVGLSAGVSLFPTLSPCPAMPFFQPFPVTSCHAASSEAHMPSPVRRFPRPAASFGSKLPWTFPLAFHLTVPSDAERD